ncbi:hypothetical protein G6F57_021695 [Rhizopus arrhizus]|nr:hypothetical protein G6F57_021695 [Rhizopus arrhizus]
MRASTSRAARSARNASSAASSVDTLQARCRSRSGNSVASWSASGRPAAGSAAVWRAMCQAASTVWRRAASEKSEVEADPRLWPA